MITVVVDCGFGFCVVAFDVGGLVGLPFGFVDACLWFVWFGLYGCIGFSLLVLGYLFYCFDCCDLPVASDLCFWSLVVLWWLAVFGVLVSNCCLW